MRSLSLLVLLLFAVVVRTVDSSPPATQTFMDELLANGARQKLKSYNNLYLTDDRPAIYGLNIWALPKQDYLQDWTIERMNDVEVVIKSNRVSANFFIGHNTDDDYTKEAKVANDKQTQALLTPVKNEDGTWSFKSRENKWLSAYSYYYDTQRHYVNFQPSNQRCERWKLEPYTPPATPTLMDELLKHGGKWQFKAQFNGFYLTDDHSSSYFWTMPPQVMNFKQDWTIVQMNNNEVAIKSDYRNCYIGHGSGGWAAPADVPDSWEMLTPVKNADGSWSFHSRYDKWLSGHSKDDSGSYYVNFETNNWKCEKWILEPIY